MEQASPETELLDRARAGDALAFGSLVSAYLPRVIAVARGYVGDSGDAEDVAQEVFFKVHRKLATFREDSSFFTWLYRITINTATDFVKRRGNRKARQIEEFERLPVADSSDSPITRITREELRAEIRDSMALLPEQFRAVLVLREIEQLSYEEIAETMACAIGTVESRLFRARARLKVLLERRLNIRRQEPLP